MPEDLHKKTFIRVSGNETRASFSSVPKRVLIIQGKIPLGLVYAIMALVAMFGQNRADLILEKIHGRRIVR